MSERGVYSGERHSTCTVDASPCALITSNAIVALRTTRVSRRGPSMMRRLRRHFSIARVTHCSGTHRWGWTSGLGNLPRIRDCHCTSFLRDSDSRFPSFMFVARDEISVSALSRGSM